MSGSNLRNHRSIKLWVGQPGKLSFHQFHHNSLITEKSSSIRLKSLITIIWDAPESERMIIGMKKVFVCCPNQGALEKNTKQAVYAARIICGAGYVPIVPHLYFPKFLDDNDQHERIQGVELGVELMKVCDEIWLLGPNISAGMEYELESAKRLGIPVRMYDEQLREINPRTLILDDRVDNHFRNVVKGLKFERKVEWL